MQIYSFNLYNNYSSSFEGRGKPISLQYVLEKRKDLLPQRVLEEASEIVKKDPESSTSLKELHLKIYSKLLKCKTLNEAKESFPEFSGISDTITFEKSTANIRNFQEKTKGMDFPLKILQELWANLKKKEDVANELGLTNRSWLNWILEQINFVYFSKNYKTLIKASDVVENQKIAQKTRDYNAAHQEEMYAKNKHAAQACKKEEYRVAQRKRMFEYDKQHPERREKISEFNRKTWELCPDIKQALSDFAREQGSYIQRIIMKNNTGRPLSECENRINKSFYKKFWTKYPELRKTFSAAKAQVRKEMQKDK